jgi:hypothetical protein
MLSCSFEWSAFKAKDDGSKSEQINSTKFASFLFMAKLLSSLKWAF